MRQRVGRRGHGAQQAVDPHAHREAVAERFDMDVAGAQLHGLFEQVVDGAHDRRAAGEIAQTFDVVVGAGARALPLSAVAASSPPRRSPRTVAISSKEATSTATAPPRTISAARTAAVSLGSATASLKWPFGNSNGNTAVSRRKRGEKRSVKDFAATSSGKLSRFMP